MIMNVMNLYYYNIKSELIDLNLSVEFKNIMILKYKKKYSEYNANPIQLFKLFKDTIKEYYKLEKSKITANKQLKNKTKLKKEIEKIKFIGNDIELQYNYTLNDLLNKITEINNERFNEYNDCP
jgi:hypothetical protein